MSGRVVRLDPATHKVVDTLLPWFVNGTLDADEHALVERHLVECARCRQEIEWLRGLHAALVAGEAGQAGSGAFRKLRRRLATPRRRGSGVARGLLRGPWTHWVIGAQLVLLATLGTVTFQTVFQDPDRTARYRTLGATDAATQARGILVVVFDPGTPEAELRRVLREAGARVVDGPTASNAYVLDVAASEQAQALRRLKAEHAVVLAEELASRSGH